MLTTLRNEWRFWKCTLRSDLLRVFLCPCILLLVAFFVRLFSGSSAYLYNLAICRGLFPGVILYTVMRILRITFAGVILSATLFSRGLYEQRGKVLLAAAAICVVLLSEYRLLFYAIHPWFALILSCVSILAAFRCFLIFLRCCCPGSLPALSFLVLQCIFALQLASLCIVL